MTTTIHTLPTSFSPMINAIETALLSGSLIYPIPTTVSTTGSLDTYYENRAQEGLSQDTLTRPKLRVKITDFKDSNAWFKPNQKVMFDTNVAIELAWHLDSKILRSKRSEIETNLPNAAVRIQNSLCYPNNLISSSMGWTGLASGRLNFERYTNVKYDYTNSVATAQILFSGKVAMGFVSGVPPIDIGGFTYTFSFDFD